MSDYEPHASRRAYDALARAIAAGPDDFEHPGYELLEALVSGRLSSAEREAVEGHAAVCPTCAEDLADLAAVQAAIPAAATSRVRSSRLPFILVSGLAAALLLAVWLGGRPEEVSPSPAATVARSDAGSESAAQPQAPAAAPAVQPQAPAAPVPQLLTAAEQQVVTRATSGGRLDIPADVLALAGRTGTLLGRAEDAAAFGPIAPLGTAVPTARPTFTWRRLPGATSYTVAVFDQQFTEVARGARLTGTAWTPPRDLPRGATCVWQVTAHLPSSDVTVPAPPQPEARFRVLDARTAAAIVEQQSRLAGQPLALGILLARAGLLDDAAREFERAAPAPQAGIFLAQVRTRNAAP